MIAAFAALIVTAAQLALPSAWQHWSVGQQIHVRPKSSAQLIRFAVPLAIYNTARADLSDLRVITSGGSEVPYAIDVQQPAQPVVWSDLQVYNTGFVPGRYSQAVADLGASGAPHDVLQVGVTDEDGDFFEWVAVDASDDGHVWRVVQARQPIYRFRQNGIEGRQDVAFPPTTSRYLRIRVLDAKKAFAIAGIKVANSVEIPVHRVPVPVIVALNPQSPPHRSWWDVDTHIRFLPVTAVEFAARQQAFHRLVTVSSSSNGSSWQEQAQGYIYRESGASQMLLEVPSGQDRYWRITVENGDDTPVDGLQPRLLTTPAYITFRQKPGEQYMLVFGNSRADTPQYDFTTLTTSAQRSVATQVTLGPESPNSAYVSPIPPPPWTERHAWLLWAALIVAVLVIAALSIRMMR